MKVFTILFFLFVVSTSYCQTFGYYGKKTAINLSGTFNPKFLSNTVQMSSDVLKKGYKVGYGGAVSIERQIDANRLVGLEFSMNYGSARVKAIKEMLFLSTPFGSDYSVMTELNPIKYRIMSPAFYFSFGTKSHIAPIGIVHSIGFGALFLKTQTEPLEYVSELQLSAPNSYYIDTYGEAEFRKIVDKRNNRMVEEDIYGYKTFGAKFFWQTALNVPLAKGIMWNLSVRANLQVYKNIHTLSDTQYYDYHVEMSKYERAFVETELLNVLQISTGIKFVF